MADGYPGPPHADLGGYVLGKLDAWERDAFEQHLAGCRTCQRELEELRGMPGLLDEAAAPVDVPAGLESRVMAAIAREPRRGPAAAPAPRLERRRRRIVPWALGLAASLAITFMGGFGMGRALPGAAPVAAPPDRTIRLVAADGSAATGVATVRRQSGGQVIELTVHDLPPPPAGRFYTCWLVADDDTLQHQDRVSVGSFTTSANGTATVRWETAADLSRYPHLGVTLEPDNGNPMHQGPKVLAASA